jgi:hypothetical protein
MKVFEVKLCAISLAIDVAIENPETLQKHAVKLLPVFSDSQATIGGTPHLELGLGQHLARQMNRRVGSLLTHGITTEVHLGTGLSGIPRNKDADCHANLSQEASGSLVMERPHTSDSNRARPISEGRSVAKAECQADKCRKHFRYRLMGKVVTMRPVPMTSIKPLEAKFYQLMSGQHPRKST